MRDGGVQAVVAQACAPETSTGLLAKAPAPAPARPGLGLGHALAPS